ncbi:MAG TPA: SDR family NAD(P)-dependent oxidoreductase [Chitinophagales bacterium]|nr:SDR family NAD(P)-dependent oxidoreductase [Chitinophagales bacterium]MCB9074095.1 SDR family NAD(P)-dependent oxidoreductase [Chitinophagales bacterium]HMU97318.1 SDR family NAD(P)-dependent oxidoreductase [Chitinophagales bacterium]HMV01831.1 SDR family NAD(P)-dependent oxidoreductase [Chitinophagales bacterium]HMW93792.1 SDR family NAD(P)-dependent oxidoreductase [Chitinophagales bacterium]
MANIILITGATAGFGKATAIKFAAAGWNIIITGRRKERLESLEKNLKSTYNIDVLSLCFDVRNLEEVKSAINSLEEKWQAIDVLINNAGLAAGKGPIQEGLYDDWEQMIDTNVKGLLYMTREIAPLMIKRNQGHIINVASLAGWEAYGGGNVYCGTKHAVRAISRGARIDLVQHNIKVSVVSPGAADTEFSLVRFKWDKDKADSVYEGFQPLQAEDIANSIYFMATQPAHVNIEEIFILPTAQATSNVIHKTK